MSQLIIYWNFGFVLQNCDLAQHSIVHIVESPQKTNQNKEEPEGNCTGGTLRALETEPGSLTRVDLSTSILPSLSEGLAVILDTTKSSISLPSEKSGKVIWYISIQGSFLG